MIDRRKMSGFIGALALFCCIGTAYGQDNYTTGWAHHATVVLNTSFTGANVYNDVYKFPVLIRLNPSNFPAFSQLNYSGSKPIDIRFSKSSDYTKHFPYQIDYYSSTKDTAVIWVLVDTVFGGNDAQTITMHYGNSSASDSSNGSTVFDTANGYRGVWHLADSLDATYDAFNKTNTGNNPTDTMGIIGHARAFSGTQYMQMGTVSSSISSTNVPYGGPWTLSAWVYFAAGSTGEMDFVGTGDHAYNIQRASGNNFEMDDFSTQFERFDGPTVTTGAWHYVYAVRARTDSTLTSNMPGDSFYVDGGGAITNDNAYNNGNTRSTGHPFTIGRKGDNTGNYLKGYLDEVEMSNVARTGDWAQLTYQNQQQTQTLVTIVMPTAPVPVLSSPTNGASGQPLSLTLSWNSVIPIAGTASYSIQVSTANDFSSTVLSLTGLSTTSAAVGSLSYYATYFWHVNATDGSGTSKWATSWSFSTIQLAPPAPILSSPSNGAAGQLVSLSLSWGTSSGATSYAVQVSTGSTFANTVFSQTGAGVTAAVTAGLVYGGVTYYWQASAISNTGATWSGIWSFTTLSVPASPALVSPTNSFVNGAPLTVSWSTVATATSYTAQVAITSDFSTTTFSQSGLTTSYTFTPSTGVLNYLRVSASNAAGIGAWATVWTLTPTVSVAGKADLSVEAYAFSMKQSMIVYSLPKAGQVELSICDMLGRTAMAVNRMQDAGHYTIDLKSSPLASGRYTVRFKAGAIEKRAMLILTR